MAFLDLDTIAKVNELTTKKSYDCKQCKLYLNCQNPKIPAYGEGRLGIMIIGGQISTAQENSQNKKQGTHYQYLKKRLKDIGIDIYKDCWYTWGMRCYKDDDNFTDTQMSACASLLQNDIKKLKPKVIVITDNIGWDVLLSNRMEGSRADCSLWDYAGNLIPDQELKTWVLPIHPTKMLLETEAEMARKKKEYGERYTPINRFEPHYTNELNLITEALTKELPIYQYDTKVYRASNVEEALSFIEKAQKFKVFAFDYETSGKSWHNPQQFIHSVSFSDGDVSYAMLWYKDDKRFMKAVQELLTNDAIKIAQNKGFERSWSIGRAGVEPKNLKHDPMLMAHVWRNLAPTGLKFILYREFGILGYDESMEQYLKPHKDETKRIGKNALNTIHKAPIQDVLYYVGLDSLFTFWLAKHYLKVMDKEHMMPGYNLLARAERPLTHMHLNGLRVNMEAITYWKPILQDRIDGFYLKIMQSEFIEKTWVGSNKFSPNSDPDLRKLLFGILRLKPVAYTDKGLASTDADALEAYKYDVPIIPDLLEYRRWYKLLNTFIAQLEREQWDGIIHSYFTLNNVDSYRSGSNSVNLTNQPKHDKEVMNVIRSLFLPSKGNFLTSCDYAQLEVRANAAITRDKNLVNAVQGNLDMHTAMSKKLFMLDDTQTNKKARNVAKTNVFRLFYGGSGAQMAEGTWKIINSSTAKDQLGMEMLSHIKSNGIASYENWEEHCIKVEKWLWGELFSDYQKWRKTTYTQYLKDGYLYYPNGFTYQGIASRNSILNGPGQGAGFHVNLSAICGMFEEMEERKMRSKLVEIHDDLMGDVVPEEEELYKELLYKHMVKKAPEYNSWITGIPLEIEYGKSDIDKPWSEIKEVGALHY